MFAVGVFSAVLFTTLLGTCISCSTVAFQATINTNPTVHLNQKVILPVVKHNKGDGYDPATGIFTCPISGMYSFSAHLQRRVPASAYTMVYLNKGSSATYLHPLLMHASSHKYVGDGVTVVTECLAGEQVFLEVRGAPSTGCQINHTFNRFSGFLISIN